MRPEYSIVGLIFLVVAAALAYAAWKLFAGPKKSEGRTAGGVFAAIGAVFMAWWAINMLSAGL